MRLMPPVDRELPRRRRTRCGNGCTFARVVGADHEPSPSGPAGQTEAAEKDRPTDGIGSKYRAKVYIEEVGQGPFRQIRRKPIDEIEVLPDCTLLRLAVTSN